MTNAAQRHAAQTAPVTTTPVAPTTNGVTTATPAEAEKPLKNKAPKPAPKCGCGCDVITRGGKFIPGHDAKLKSRLLDAAMAGDRDAEEQLRANDLHSDWHWFLVGRREVAAAKAAARDAKAAAKVAAPATS